MRPSLRRAALALVVSVLAGCSSHQRHTYLRDQTATHAYAKPLAEVWPQVKDLLDARGYSWRELPDRYVLETEWLDSGGGTLGPTSSTRYLIEGILLPDGRCVLRALRNDRVQQSVGVSYTDKGGGGSSSGGLADQSAVGRNTSGLAAAQKQTYRDLELELEFLRRLEPRAASALEAEAAAKYP